MPTVLGRTGVSAVLAAGLTLPAAGQVQLEPLAGPGVDSVVAGPIVGAGPPAPVSDRRFVFLADFGVPGEPFDAFGLFTAEAGGPLTPLTAGYPFDPLPGLSGVDGVDLIGLDDVVSNRRGAFAVSAREFDGPSALGREVILAGRAGDLSLLVRDGDAVPDRPGAVFDGLVQVGPRAFDPQGRLVFGTLVDLPGAATAYALFRVENGEPVEIAGPQRPLPNTPGSLINVLSDAELVASNGDLIIRGSFDLPVQGGGTEPFAGIVRVTPSGRSRFSRMTRRCRRSTPSRASVSPRPARMRCSSIRIASVNSRGCSASTTRGT